VGGHEGGLLVAAGHVPRFPFLGFLLVSHDAPRRFRTEEEPVARQQEHRALCPPPQTTGHMSHGSGPHNC
jgi:hypothetical protein